MESLGFLAVVGLACYLLFMVYGLNAMTLAFKGEWNPWSLIPLLISLGLFWWAYTQAPFAIVAR